MKYILNFVIIIVFLSFFSCKKDYSPLEVIPSEFSSADDSNIPDSIRSLYKLDAAILAVNHMYENKLPDTASVHIPGYLIQSVYSGLICIYNCKKIPFTEFLTKTKPIHNGPYYPLQYFTVGFDTSFSWTKQWVDGFKFTGNDTIDNLLIEYELEPQGEYRWLGSLSLFSEEPLNMRYLGKIFNEISGIRYAEPAGIQRFEQPYSDIIRANLESSNIKYIFLISKWGDCPDFCVYNHYWEYIVTDAGEVRFLDDYVEKIEFPPIY